jgi:hypothetical protein
VKSAAFLTGIPIEILTGILDEFRWHLIFPQLFVYGDDIIDDDYQVKSAAFLSGIPIELLTGILDEFH